MHREVARGRDACVAEHVVRRAVWSATARSSAWGAIIGDNGCFFIVVDIAIVPELQGQGLGQRVMAALDAWLLRNVPPSAYVTLVADGDAKYLYAKFGFVESAPVAVNMEYVMEAGGVKSHRHLET